MGIEGQWVRLLDRAKAGDREAFDEVTQPMRGRLLAFARTRIGKALRRRLEPDDVVQDAMLKAFQSIRGFRGANAESLWSWLAGISEHLILNASRRRSLTELSLAREEAGSRASPSRALRREERLARLERSLARLKPEQREVIILSKIEGLPTCDIAKRLGVSDGSVRQAISRGLKALRERFGDTESLHLPERGLERGVEDAG